MKTVRATWYEAWIKKGYGAKLADRYSNQREAKSAIKKSIEEQKKAGWKPNEYYLMIADYIHIYDENGTISTTTTYARVSEEMIK